MESAVNIAAYIIARYRREYGDLIDEMKLHKLLYFAQREALIQLGEPLFDDLFYAWKYGPVLVSVRNIIKYNGMDALMGDPVISEKYNSVFDKVFSQYACKNSWSLSRLSHGEYSWQIARKGLAQEDNCDKPISIEDIKVDAERIKIRRYFISKLDSES